MGYFNFYILRKILNNKKFKKFIFYFLIFLFFLFIWNNVVNAATIQPTEDIFNEIIERQRYRQNTFVLFSLKPYIGNTEMWEQPIKEVYDYVTGQQYNIYVDVSHPYVNADNTTFIITLFRNSKAESLDSYYSNSGQSVNILNQVHDNCIIYNINYSYSNNSCTYTVTYDNDDIKIPKILFNYKSDMFVNFCNIYTGITSDYNVLLNSIITYLSNIQSVDNSILSSLNSLSSILSNIQQNTSSDYSQQISQISSKISDILSDNDTIISQNSSMIQQQEQINDNLEQVSSDIQDVKDTITDDTVESTASDLPSADVNNPTENGIDNIFQSIYNAFCTGEAQDIVFPIPFTNKNITLNPYYVRDALNNNNAGWVYTLIQAFWGYLIGRYIVSDISKKIDKIKSGNIENVENSNIKEEML